MVREKFGKIINSVLPYLLMLFLLADTAFSFFQFMSATLDGDMCSIIYPSPGYTPVMEDPFALNVLLNNEVYAAPNRFFAHWTMAEYFRSMPLFLQSFTDPITSLYSAGAVAKTLMQVLIIFILSSFIGATRDIRKLAFLVPAVLITPLFQTDGFTQLMGIIDLSVTYSFFYALPTGILLLYFSFLLKPWYYGEKARINGFIFVVLFVIAVCLPLSGPLVPPVVILSFLIIFIQQFFSPEIAHHHGFINKVKALFLKQPTRFWILVIIIGLMSLYSFYVGMNNAEQQWAELPLSERFKRLPKGLFEIITTKAGFPVLLLFITVNMLIIRRLSKSKSPEAARILSLGKWFLVFSLIYILLLPFGGYRSYRPNIIRYDTFIPVTLCLIILYGISAWFILRNLKALPKLFYVLAVISFLAYFTISDKEINHWNGCEWQALKDIRDSPDELVELHTNCSVFYWGPVLNKDDSRLNGEMMNYWNITDRAKLYYQVIDEP